MTNLKERIEENKMFNFFGMADNYEDRKVDRYEKNGLMVDTCSVTDGNKPFETAVESPEYNNGKMVIVQSYDTIEEAKEGHLKWVDLMLNNPPEYLRDCANAEISQLIELFSEDMMIFPRKEK